MVLVSFFLGHKCVIHLVEKDIVSWLINKVSIMAKNQYANKIHTRFLLTLRNKLQLNHKQKSELNYLVY